VSYVIFFVAQTITETNRRIVVLQRNWRSHGAIIAWSNRYIYADVMRDYGNAYITYHLVNSGVLPKRGFPIVFHGVKGSDQRTKWSPSCSNVLEASIVRNYCVKLIRDPERKICERGTFYFSTTSYVLLTRCRPWGDWRSHIVQSPSQSHSTAVEGGKLVRCFGWLSRAVPGTGLV
jgi:AAA domain